MLWLAEDDCAAAQGATSRNSDGGLALYLRLRGLRPGAHAKSGGRRGSLAVSPGRSVTQWVLQRLLRRLSPRTNGAKEI
jgi:hypothetical protein